MLRRLLFDGSRAGKVSESDEESNGKDDDGENEDGCPTNAPVADHRHQVVPNFDSGRRRWRVICDPVDANCNSDKSGQDSCTCGKCDSHANASQDSSVHGDCYWSALTVAASSELLYAPFARSSRHFLSTRIQISGARRRRNDGTIKRGRKSGGRQRT